MVSILGEHEPYIFPKPIKLEKRLKDVLENEVDEKYYLNNEKAEQLIATITEKNDITNPTVVDATVNEPKTKEIMNTITARYDAGIQNYKSIGGAVIEPEIKQVGNTTPNPKRENPQTGRMYDADGDKRVLEPKIDFGRMGRQAIETYNEKQPNYGDTVNPFNKTVDSSNNCPTSTTRPEGFKTAILPVTQDYRIRKLTPKECWRLMGISDEDFYKAQAVNSNAQLYKQAGNSIVVNVLEGIFANMFYNN